MDIDKLITQANHRLKVARTGLQILRRGSKLSLRGTFPPKRAGEEKKQQILSLDLFANAAGIKRAEQEAYKISAAIALKEFDWKEYLSPEPEERKTVADWIAEFEDYYFTKRPKNPKTLTTWRTDYLRVFSTLPTDVELTKELLINNIIMKPPNSRQRQRFLSTLSYLAKFAGIEIDKSRYRGNYSPKSLTPRDIPTDEEIVAQYKSIAHDGWRYVYGLMACYGIRNHEAFNLDLQSLTEPPGILTVLDGKTGGRRIWPCYPEWWERWDLYDTSRLPLATGKDNQTLGARVTQAFKRYNVTAPYNLRHAWAIRSLEFGLDISLAAHQMGHSVKIHSEIYHHWISDRHHQKAFDLIMQRSDRPTAPI